MPSRARVKTGKPATRAQASAEFGRKKAKQRRQVVKRRILLGAAGLIAGYATISFAWALHTGKVQEFADASEARLWQGTASLGFRIDQITLAGRNHTSAEEVKTALGAAQGAPILAVSLAQMKARLEAIPDVDTVQIRRVLPSELQVTITERVPVALWQKGGVQRLIDAKGVALTHMHYNANPPLPVVVGEDAPTHVMELMALLNTTPSLKSDVAAAVRIGGRRWNVQLRNDVTVMLPEDKPEEAWKRFANLVEKQALFSKAIRSVDMRIEDRIFIAPLEQNKNPVTLTSARDT